MMRQLLLYIPIQTLLLEYLLASLDNHQDRRIINSFVETSLIKRSGPAYNINTRCKWCMIRLRRLNVGESFHSSVLSIHLFFLYLFLQSCWNGSLISPLEASIQRLVKLSTDITNFTFHPFSASNVATTTASQRVPHSNSLPDLLRHYPIFLPLNSFHFVGYRARSTVNQYSRISDKMVGWVSSVHGGTSFEWWMDTCEIASVIANEEQLKFRELVVYDRHVIKKARTSASVQHAVITKLSRFVVEIDR